MHDLSGDAAVQCLRAVVVVPRGLELLAEVVHRELVSGLVELEGGGVLEPTVLVRFLATCGCASTVKIFTLEWILRRRASLQLRPIKTEVFVYLSQLRQA